MRFFASLAVGRSADRRPALPLYPITLITMSGYNSPGLSCSFPSDGVLVVKLDRAPVNAFNTQLWISVASAFDEASQDPNVRAVVFGSNLDKGFTAGLDLMSVLSSPPRPLLRFLKILGYFRHPEPPCRQGIKLEREGHRPGQDSSQTQTR